MNISVFFVADNQSAPYLSVSLCSLCAYASAEHTYTVTVLTHDMDKANREKLCHCVNAPVALRFSDLPKDVAQEYAFAALAGLYPDLSRAVCLEAGAVLCADVAELYQVPLGQHLLAAAPDYAFRSNPTLARYAKQHLGVEPSRYFNDGVMVLNLDAFRAKAIAARFSELIARTDDLAVGAQDIWNALCSDSTYDLDRAWNMQSCTSLPTEEKARLYHYEKYREPWHYAGVPHEDEFWKYRVDTPYGDALNALREKYTDEEKCSDLCACEVLVKLAGMLSEVAFAYGRA